MSLQDSLTSSRQGKANWHSRRPLFLCALCVLCALAGCAGSPACCLAQPAAACVLPRVQAARCLRDAFLPRYPQPGPAAPSLNCVKELISLREAQGWPPCHSCLGIRHFLCLEMRLLWGDPTVQCFLGRGSQTLSPAPLILQLWTTPGWREGGSMPPQ